MFRSIAFFILLFVSFLVNAQAVSPCAKDAISRAKPLLEFHFGKDDRIEIEDHAKELPSFRNPANPKQTLKVYEVWGYIYKGRYRMRLIYYASTNSSCLLMGQEILEFASL